MTIRSVRTELFLADGQTWRS